MEGKKQAHCPSERKASSPMQGRKDTTLPCRLPVSLRLSDGQTCGHTRDHKGREMGRQGKKVDRQAARLIVRQVSSKRDYSIMNLRPFRTKPGTAQAVAQYTTGTRRANQQTL